MKIEAIPTKVYFFNHRFNVALWIETLASLPAWELEGNEGLEGWEEQESTKAQDCACVSRIQSRKSPRKKRLTASEKSKVKSMLSLVAGLHHRKDKQFAYSVAAALVIPFFDTDHTNGFGAANMQKLSFKSKCVNANSPCGSWVEGQPFLSQHVLRSTLSVRQGQTRRSFRSNQTKSRFGKVKPDEEGCARRRVVIFVSSTF